MPLAPPLIHRERCARPLEHGAPLPPSRLVAGQVAATFKEVGSKAPLPPDQLATAMIALDVGLTVQDLVDREEVPLEVYVPLFDLLFGSVVDAQEP